MVPPTMLEPHTARFVFADGIVEGYRRGDLLYKDIDGTFKWVDPSGALSSSRPETPITMNDRVVSGENPFGGEVSPIPVVSTSLEAPASGGVNVTSEDELKTAGRTYTFDFDTTYAVALMVGSSSLSTIQTVKDLVGSLHFQGLLSDEFTFGSSGTSTLTIQ